MMGKTSKDFLMPEKIDPQLCSHLLLAFGKITKDGQLFLGNTESDKSKENGTKYLLYFQEGLNLVNGVNIIRSNK